MSVLMTQYRASEIGGKASGIFKLRDLTQMLVTLWTLLKDT